MSLTKEKVHEMLVETNRFFFFFYMITTVQGNTPFPKTFSVSIFTHTQMHTFQKWEKTFMPQATTVIRRQALFQKPQKFVWKERKGLQDADLCCYDKKVYALN